MDNMRETKTPNQQYQVMLEPMHEATRRGLHILKTESKGFTWRQWFALLIAVFSLGLVFFSLIIQQPNTHYDRSLDSELAKYIHVSPEAANLPKKGQLFCWTMTAKGYHKTRAPAVNETWLPRCDHGQFFTNFPFDSELKIAHSTIFAGIPDSYSNLFFKSRYAFFHIYTKISKDFEWYLKADDDTYVIVENLRSYLSKLNPDLPYYIGYRLRPYLEHGYNAGGAGYVLSRAAMKIFAEQLYSNASLCPDDIYEDVGIGRCLANVGIYPLDTRNSRGQQRFNTFRPDEVFHGSVVESPYWMYDVEIRGYDGVGTDLISFHHLTPDEIRLFDILLYRVRKPSNISL
ncbi:unnamed protein product, partial [Mesorhabditis belari]|uniref:N-acetylgalactosaminide beta-1,3-galactosyltransferase n=1 Tax=Mesorhabditis belari TaxID=2138241 RepID=A0AAF3F2X8_9BILA